MVKLIAVTLKELRGPYILLSKNTCLKLGIDRGDYIVISVGKRRAVAIVRDILSRIGTIGVSIDIARALGLKEVDLVDIYRPTIERAGKVYVRIVDGVVDHGFLKKYLLGKVVMNNSLISIPLGNSSVKVNVLVEFGDNNKLYIIDYNTDLEIATDRSRSNGNDLRNDIELSKDIVDAIEKSFRSLSFMVERCSLTRNRPETIDLRAYKVVDDLVYEIWVICKYHRRVVDEKTIDNIFDTICRTDRLPNMVILVVGDIDSQAMHKARSKGFIVIKNITGDSRDLGKIFSTRLERIFKTLAGTSLEAKGESILTKIKNMICLRSVVGRAVEVET